ncbi:MAG: Gfo/Idh/MocA family oxidoreductase [Lachnospiraceae bacterium]|nr:Gfo/Idh/MocA family oxidoreductase [Lachnospiraceae bacterium]
MKAVVIGLGSMGRRRLRLLRGYDESIMLIGVDKQEERRLQAESEFSIKTFESISDACALSPDVAFVSTSPLSHSAIIKECLERGLHVFTEINLTDSGYDENVKLAREAGRVLFLSSTPMYRKEIEYIKSRVNSCGTKKSYIYHVGQYLPDWHPWENYKDFFVGDRRTNGCREIMAIEFPWLFDVFGFPEKVSVQKRKMTELAIDYPDSYQIMIDHGNNMGILQIDVMSRKAVRNFECMSEDMYISWDGTPDGLKTYDTGKKEEIPVALYENYESRSEYSASIIEDAYLSEITEFLGAVEGRAGARHSFEKDKNILSIIDEIESDEKG